MFYCELTDAISTESYANCNLIAFLYRRDLGKRYFCINNVEGIVNKDGASYNKKKRERNGESYIETLL